jgi:hypothetical protein
MVAQKETKEEIDSEKEVMELAKQLAAGTGAQDPTSLFSHPQITNQKKITASDEEKAHGVAQKIINE